jgi:hypothetical protein
VSNLITLRHTTPRANLRSITRTGLSPVRSQGARQEVWLHSPFRGAWALRHLSAHHGIPQDDLAIVTVRIPRAWISRKRRGIWVCPRLIHPECIMSINPRAALAVAVNA